MILLSRQAVNPKTGMGGVLKILILWLAISFITVFFVYAGIPWICGKIYKLSLDRKSVRSNAFVLTFDDGPGSRLTPVILDILREHKVRATFFLLGRNIEGREHIVKRIVDEGHEICSHGYHHLSYWKISPLRAVSDIKRGWRAIDTALNQNNRTYPFRPPFGKLNIFCLLYLWFRRVPILYWTIELGDTYSSLEKFNIQNRKVIERLKKTGILLAHDFDRSGIQVDDTVINSIGRILTISKKEGLHVIPFSELFQRVR